MKTFIKHDIPSLKRIDSPSGRRYATPEGNLYPSVTTIVGASQDTSWLEEWRKNIGEDVANKITKESSERGSFLHECCEKYLREEPIKFHFLQHLEKEMFGYYKPVLEQIDNIHAIELPLWSDKLKCAGTVDLIAEFNQELYIIDWKNSLRYKGIEDIPGYFMQMSAYAAMFYERTGIKVKDLLVVISVKDYGLVTHTQKTADWVPKFIEVRKTFEK